MENWLDVVSVNAYRSIFKGSIDTSVSAMAKGPLPSSEVIYADANSQDTKRPFVECSFWTLKVLKIWYAETRRLTAIYHLEHNIFDPELQTLEYMNLLTLIDHFWMP